MLQNSLGEIDSEKTVVSPERPGIDIRIGRTVMCLPYVVVSSVMSALVLGGSCVLTVESEGQGTSQVVVRSDLSICPPFTPVPDTQGEIAVTVPAGTMPKA